MHCSDLGFYFQDLRMVPLGVKPLVTVSGRAAASQACFGEDKVVEMIIGLMGLGLLRMQNSGHLRIISIESWHQK